MVAISFLQPFLKLLIIQLEKIMEVLEILEIQELMILIQQSLLVEGMEQ